MNLFPMNTCLLCQASLSGPTLELGKLPPCNRFAPQAEFSTPTYSLTLSECPNCSLVQLLDPPPIEALIPRVPWLRYNEPDAHLDAVLAHVLPQLQTQVPIYGVSPFDQPLLDQFAAQGHPCEALDLLAAEPKNNTNHFPYLETLQDRLQPQFMRKRAQGKTPGQLLLCRYLLEHCRDPLAALNSFRPLLAENGLALIEVPDSSKFLMRQDYSFIWEEHVCYFTEATLRRLIAQAGYKLLNLMKYEGELEDAMVALVQPLPQEIMQLAAIEPKTASLFAPYAAAFANQRLAYQAALATICERGGKIAIFGAGHQAILFINALGLQDYIAYVVDDDVNKQAYFSPGAHLPIVSSARMLADDRIDTCLLAVSPRVESKIQDKCAAFLQRGGKMYSIFPGSHLYKAPRWEREANVCTL